MAKVNKTDCEPSYLCAIIVLHPLDTIIERFAGALYFVILI